MKLRSLKYLKAADIIRVDSSGFEPEASLPCSEGSALRASQPSAPRRKGAQGCVQIARSSTPRPSAIGAAPHNGARVDGYSNTHARTNHTTRSRRKLHRRHQTRTRSNHRRKPPIQAGTIHPVVRRNRHRRHEQHHRSETPRVQNLEARHRRESNAQEPPEHPSPIHRVLRRHQHRVHRRRKENPASHNATRRRRRRHVPDGQRSRPNPRLLRKIRIRDAQTHRLPHPLAHRNAIRRTPWTRRRRLRQPQRNPLDQAPTRDRDTTQKQRAHRA